MSKKTVIFGCSKIADVLYQEILDDAQCNMEIVAFCVEEKYRMTDDKYGKPVVAFENVEKRYPPSDYNMLIAIGYHDMNRVRARVMEQTKKKGYDLQSYISSKAIIYSDVTLGDSDIILGGVNIGPHTALGDGVVIFPGATISHHVEVGNHIWITSGTVIGGNSTVGDNCFLGISCAIGHNTHIGNLNFIGSKAIVTKDTEKGEVHIIADTPKYRLNSEQFIKMFRFD